MSQDDLPQTKHEALRARDDARSLADKARSHYLTGDDERRGAELLAMLHALLIERLERDARAPSGRCEQCGHSPDDIEEP